MSGYVKGMSAEEEFASIRAAANRASTAIEAWPDPDRAFELVLAGGEMFRELSRQYADFRAYLAARLLDANAMSLAQLAAYMGVSRSRAAQLVTIGREKGNPVTNPGTDPEPAPVAAAIITSELGVLVERRNDRIPPWTFPAGEILPGESPAACLIRRIPQETGLAVTPVQMLGRRIHPKTGRVMIYMLATAEGTDVQVGDPVDLAEVRWASVAETRQIMPDMYPAVRAHLDSLGQPATSD